MLSLLDSARAMNFYIGDEPEPKLIPTIIHMIVTFASLVMPFFVQFGYPGIAHITAATPPFETVVEVAAMETKSKPDECIMLDLCGALLVVMLFFVKVRRRGAKRSTTSLIERDAKRARMNDTQPLRLEAPQLATPLRLEPLVVAPAPRLATALRLEPLATGVIGPMPKPRAKARAKAKHDRTRGPMNISTENVCVFGSIR